MSATRRRLLSMLTGVSATLSRLRSAKAMPLPRTDPGAGHYGLNDCLAGAIWWDGVWAGAGGIPRAINVNYRKSSARWFAERFIEVHGGPPIGAYRFMAPIPFMRGFERAPVVVVYLRPGSPDYSAVVNKTLGGSLYKPARNPIVQRYMEAGVIYLDLRNAAELKEHPWPIFST